MKITKINITEQAPVSDEIRSFLNANFSTVFHEPEFNQIVENIFKTRFYYQCAYNDSGKLVALCPCHSSRKRLTVFLQSNPSVFEVPYGGWVFDRQKVKIPELMSGLRLAFNEGITYWSLPQIEVDDYTQIKVKLRFQTAIVDLAQSETEIWEKSINAKRRNMIRKAEKNGMTVEKVYDHKRFSEYRKMMAETYSSAHLEIKPDEYYEDLLRAYAPKNKAVILLARLRSIPVAGVMLLRNDHMCHYWLGAGEKGIDNLGQGELLQWEAIKWAKENHSRFYDLCVLEPERLPDIARFKSGFSSRIVPFYCISKRSAGYRFLSKLIRQC